jgi:hypothetical protein
MPTSPEAGSVVERLRRGFSDRAAHSKLYRVVHKSDLEALLAVVEAAKDVRTQGDVVTEGAVRNEVLIHRILWNALCEAVDALYTPDSADSKDAEGAKP